MRPRGALRVEVSEFRWPTLALSSGRRAHEVRLSLAYLLPCFPVGYPIMSITQRGFESARRAFIVRHEARVRRDYLIEEIELNSTSFILFDRIKNTSLFWNSHRTLFLDKRFSKIKCF